MFWKRAIKVNKSTTKGFKKPYLQDFYVAWERNDVVAMLYALEKNAETCPSRNSYCLNEVFCPECPFENGGLSVHR